MIDKLKEIRSFEDLKDFIILYKDSIKKAALPLTVAVAILFFWISGLESESKIEESTVAGQGNESQGLYEDDGQYGDDGELYTDDSRYAEIGGTSGEISGGMSNKIYVDIGGCVKNPGVYKVDEGTRLFQLVERAGGFTEGADTDSINQAEKVYDGQKIIIYSVDENNYSHSGGYGSSSGDGYGQSGNQNGKININRANSSELQEIPGVGPATAQKIIEYRESIGRFNSIEDIKNVSGIGDKTFESMKDYITV